MEKILRSFDSHEEAEAAARADDDRLTYLDRLAAFMALMKPYYDASPDFREFIALMISARVRFVMIGGYAYNLYRNPRATGDIEFLVAFDATNEARLRDVLTEFGFGSAIPEPPKKLLQRKKVLMMGRAPFRIDILCEIDGVTYQEVEASSLMFEIDGLRVPVISPEMLLKNKSATARDKDASDVVELKAWLRDQCD